MQINEAVSKGDLKNMVNNIVSIDQYKSKIDEDRNIVVMAFEVYDQNAAFDLSNFIETGTSEVEDTEVSSGSNLDGNYMVFVEVRRGQKLHETIRNVLDDVSKLTNEISWMYDTGKQGVPKSLDTLEEDVTNDPVEYTRRIDANAISERMRFLTKY
tara:strand:- start:5481 stop:5948 length:468 start_codon:yes stop_codon:yes gene_type:complete